MPNFKGIYAVLSQIWKCRKPRSFCANFLSQKLVGANFYAFCNYVVALNPCLGYQIYVKIFSNGGEGRTFRDSKIIKYNDMSKKTLHFSAVAC